MTTYAQMSKFIANKALRDLQGFEIEKRTFAVGCARAVQHLILPVVRRGLPWVDETVKDCEEYLSLAEDYCKNSREGHSFLTRRKYIAGRFATHHLTSAPASSMAAVSAVVGVFHEDATEAAIIAAGAACRAYRHSVDRNIYADKWAEQDRQHRLFVTIFDKC